MWAANTPVVPSEPRHKPLPGTRTHFVLPEYKSLAQWQARREQLRRQVLVSAGLWPMPKRRAFSVRRYGRVERDTWAVEKIALETLPGFFVGGNIYWPKGPAGKRPAVLIPHGHWKHGRAEDIPTYSVPALGANLAAQGYVAFAWDMVGYNDTKQVPHNFGDSREEQLWSWGPLQLQLWNSIRALDFVAGLPEVDSSRVAVTGASGGATQTLLLAAVDDRVRVSIPVNMISTTYQGGSPCENAPGLRVGTFNVEFAAVFAPKPMLMISTTKDWTKNTPQEEYPQVRSIYQLYGRPEMLEYTQSDAEHNYDRTSRESTYKFLRRHLLGAEDSAGVRETVEPHLQPDDLLIGDSLMATAAAEDVFAGWRNLVRTPAKRETLSALVDVAGYSEYDVPVREIPGRSAELDIIVDPGGADAAHAWVRAGPTAWLAEIFKTGGNDPPYDNGRFFLTFNRSVDAHRVEDILSLVARAGSRKVTLVGIGEAAAWVELAAAIAPVKVAVRLENPEMGKLFIPGLARTGFRF
jgi:hypothetical protein